MSLSLRTAALALLATSVVLSIVTVLAPYDVAVYGVMILGPVHVLLAVRYMTGRLTGALAGRTTGVLVVLLALMVIARAVTISDSSLGHVLELVGNLVLVAFALAVGLRGAARWIAVIPLALAAIVPFLDLPWYWGLFTHLHNLIPLIFLWDWSRGSSRAHRLWFVLGNLVWMVGIPAAILVGGVDALITSASPARITSLIDPHLLIHSVSPHGAPPELGLRLLTVFAFLQSMHYVLWIVFFPVAGRSVLRRNTVLRGRAFWIIAGAVSIAVWAFYALSYADGRAVYGILGSVNLYLEQPVAVWLLLTALPAAATAPLIGALRRS